MSKRKGEAILHILDQLTKSDKEDVNIMLRVGAHLHGRDGFNLIRCAKTNEWQIVKKVNKGNAGVDEYERRHRGYTSNELSFAI
ncbi:MULTISPECIES: hypothetical protein [Bacillus]|uniref:Uncharacterized protein n=4 Tax=Bacillus TaxID=1386 RepID=A0AAP4V287_BACTU|nr:MULTISPECIES: hypothetical protein [Bacillus]MEC3055311.1 hypothetical protein [Bacillus cereus]AFV20303.1 hypothetical protein BTB_c46220 [Bacillus thuringiensis Bt407]ARP59789.1 hypothetical protein CAB88_22995 [Bacillus thuringiensis]AST04151.1 hypothetical protein BT10792_25505 [Bacillus thuringiensis]ERI03221.1 hypothetical protein BTCBT_000417 [Bacillus thuringiensis T01-328]